MGKLATVAFVAVLICQGFANPLFEDGDVAKAADVGDWSSVQNMLRQYYLIKARELQAASTSYDQPSGPYTAATNNDGSSSPGTGRFYSQREYTYQHTNNNNGVVTKDKGGLGMINDNGRVSYYDPSTGGQVQPSAYYGASNGYQGR